MGSLFQESVLSAREYAAKSPRQFDRAKEWGRYPRKLVLEPGGAGSWDAKIATFASVIKDHNDFKMYYSGRGVQFNGNIGLATSNDVKRWVKYRGNPILEKGGAGSWDDMMIWCPMVWKEDYYHMLYTGANSKSVTQVGYATSNDGVHWKKYENNPVFNDPTWAHNDTEGWGVIKVGDTYFLWYNTLMTAYSTLNPSPRELGVAISKDLIHWTPYKSSPIFASSQGIDSYHQFCAFPFRYGPFYYLIVPSQSRSRKYASFKLYRSKSPYFDPTERKFVRNIVYPGRSGDWDDHDLDTPIILTEDITRTTFVNNEMMLFYSGTDTHERWSEGLLVEKKIEQVLTATAQK
jgi:hypothetical protein